MLFHHADALAGDDDDERRTYSHYDAALERAAAAGVEVGADSTPGNATSPAVSNNASSKSEANPTDNKTAHSTDCGGAGRNDRVKTLLMGWRKRAVRHRLDAEGAAVSSPNLVTIPRAGSGLGSALASPSDRRGATRRSRSPSERLLRQTSGALTGSARGKINDGIPSQEQAFSRWGARVEQEGLIYYKTAKVHARVAMNEGVCETIVNGVVEKKTPYRQGDFIMVGSRGSRGRYPMKAMDFAARYAFGLPEPAELPDLAEEGFQLYSPSGRVFALQISTDEVASHFPKGAFVGSWGGRVTVEANDWLVVPYPAANEVYVIRQKLFPTTYAEDNDLMLKRHQRLNDPKASADAAATAENNATAHEAARVNEMPSPASPQSPKKMKSQRIMLPRLPSGEQLAGVHMHAQYQQTNNLHPLTGLSENASSDEDSEHEYFYGGNAHAEGLQHGPVGATRGGGRRAETLHAAASAAAAAASAAEIAQLAAQAERFGFASRGELTGGAPIVAASLMTDGPLAGICVGATSRGRLVPMDVSTHVVAPCASFFPMAEALRMVEFVATQDDGDTTLSPEFGDESLAAVDNNHAVSGGPDRQMGSQGSHGHGSSRQHAGARAVGHSSRAPIGMRGGDIASGGGGATAVTALTTERRVVALLARHYGIADALTPSLDTVLHRAVEAHNEVLCAALLRAPPSAGAAAAATRAGLTEAAEAVAARSGAAVSTQALVGLLTSTAASSAAAALLPRARARAYRARRRADGTTALGLAASGGARGCARLLVEALLDASFDEPQRLILPRPARWPKRGSCSKNVVTEKGIGDLGGSGTNLLGLFSSSSSSLLVHGAGATRLQDWHHPDTPAAEVCRVSSHGNREPFTLMDIIFVVSPIMHVFCKIVELVRSAPDVAARLLRSLPLAPAPAAGDGVARLCLARERRLLTSGAACRDTRHLWLERVARGRVHESSFVRGGEDCAVVAMVIPVFGVAGGGGNDTSEKMNNSGANAASRRATIAAEPGDTLLHALAACDDAAIFDGAIARALVEHKWAHFARRQFLPEVARYFCLYLPLLVYYAQLLVSDARWLAESEYAYHSGDQDEEDTNVEPAEWSSALRLFKTLRGGGATASVHAFRHASGGWRACRSHIVGLALVLACVRFVALETAQLAEAGRRARLTASAEVRRARLRLADMVSARHEAAREIEEASAARRVVSNGEGDAANSRGPPLAGSNLFARSFSKPNLPSPARTPPSGGRALERRKVAKSLATVAASDAPFSTTSAGNEKKKVEPDRVTDRVSVFDGNTSGQTRDLHSDLWGLSRGSGDGAVKKHVPHIQFKGFGVGRNDKQAGGSHLHRGMSQDEAAIVVQRTVRGQQARQQVANLARASRTLQRTVRGFLGRLSVVRKRRGSKTPSIGRELLSDHDNKPPTPQVFDGPDETDRIQTSIRRRKSQGEEARSRSGSGRGFALLGRGGSWNSTSTRRFSRSTSSRQRLSRTNNNSSSGRRLSRKKSASSPSSSNLPKPSTDGMMAAEAQAHRATNTITGLEERHRALLKRELRGERSRAARARRVAWFALSQNWNLLKLLTHSTAAASVILREVAAPPARTLSVAALAVALAFTLSLYYLRAFRRTGYLVRMIVQVTVDIKAFFLVMFIFNAGAASSFYLLFATADITRGHDDDGPFAASAPHDLFLHMVVIMLGVGTNDLDALDAATTSAPLAKAVFVCFLCAANLIALNLLIALMSDSFQRVQAKCEVECLQERARVIAELELRHWRTLSCSDAHDGGEAGSDPASASIMSVIQPWVHVLARRTDVDDAAQFGGIGAFANNARNGNGTGRFGGGRYDSNRAHSDHPLSAWADPDGGSEHRRANGSSDALRAVAEASLFKRICFFNLA